MKKIPAPLWLLAIPCALPLLAAARQDAAATYPTYVEVKGNREFTGRLIVRPLQHDALVASGLSSAQADQREQLARAEMGKYELVEYVPQTDHYVIHVPEGETENSFSHELMAMGVFQFAEPDWFAYPIGCPNDPLLGNQWHHNANRMDSCDGWTIHTGNPTTAVGICDTGIRTTHEEFQLHRLEGYNAVDRQWESAGGNISNVHPHGTMTTGCAAANGNNGKGGSGVGWDLSHRMLRVSNSSGGGAYLSDLQHAATTSIESGDKVANVSYSSVDSASNLTTATYIKSIGGLLVWAAGNDGRNLTLGNRDADDIIVAGATTSSDVKAGFSAYGIFVDLTAPGDSVYTSDASSNNAYAYVSGTSFAAPLTAGLIGLIWSADPSLTPDDVETILKTTCDDLGSSGVDNTYGYGRIDVYEAMANITPPDPAAAFTASPTSGDEDLFVAFTDQSTGTGLSTWSWTFGDGGTSALANPAYTYVNPGTYTVSLTVTGTMGNDTLTKTNYIVVNPSMDASVTSRNGSGINPNIFTTVTLPILGTSWKSQIDGGSVGASGLSFMVGYSAPISGIFTAFGELLVDTTSPWLFTSIAGGAGGISNHTIVIPNDPTLLGFLAYTQGFLNNVGGSSQLTNGLDLVLGN